MRYHSVTVGYFPQMLRSILRYMETCDSRARSSMGPISHGSRHNLSVSVAFTTVVYHMVLCLANLLWDRSNRWPNSRVERRVH